MKNALPGTGRAFSNDDSLFRYAAAPAAALAAAAALSLEAHARHDSVLSDVSKQRIMRTSVYPVSTDRNQDSFRVAIGSRLYHSGLVTDATEQSTPLQQIAPDLWTVEGGPIDFYVPPFGTFPYALRMVIVRLQDGTLFVDSPLALNDALESQIRDLGPVKHIVSPNKLHHLYMGDWAERFDEAALYASPGLRSRRSDLNFSRELCERPEPEWSADLEQCLVGGSLFMNEIVFFHSKSHSLILGDLIENHDPEPMSAWQRGCGRFNRMLAPQGETPLNYRLSFVRRAKTRAALQRVLAWNPRRVILMHGPCIERDVDAFLRRAFAWAL